MAATHEPNDDNVEPDGTLEPSEPDPARAPDQMDELEQTTEDAPKSRRGPRIAAAAEPETDADDRDDRPTVVNEALSTTGVTPDATPMPTANADRDAEDAGVVFDAEPGMDFSGPHAGDWAPATAVSFGDRMRSAASLTVAAVAHIALVSLLIAGLRGTPLGAGGDADASISIEIITLAELDRATPLKSNPPERPRNQNVETPGAAQTQAAADATVESRRQTEPSRTTPPREVKATPTPPHEPPPQGEPSTTADATPARSRPTLVEATPNQQNPTAAKPPAQKSETPAPPTEPAPPIVQTPISQDPMPASLASQGQVATDEQIQGRAQSGSAVTGGRIGTAFDQEVVRALAPLEQHLRRLQASRSAAFRGRVELSLTISPQGRAEQITVARSSGDAALDRIAVADVRAFQFPAPPPTLSAPGRTYQLPITYR